MEEKRKATEEKLKAAQPLVDPNKPSKNEIEDRQARLRAQRDLLRQKKETKRQQELEEFKQKTETKADLYEELKKMDANKKKTNALGGVGAGGEKEKTEAERRLEMYRKLRKDLDKDNKEEKEANYQKRVDEIEKKDK